MSGPCLAWQCRRPSRTLCSAPRAVPYPSCSTRGTTAEGPGRAARGWPALCGRPRTCPAGRPLCSSNPGGDAGSPSTNGRACRQAAGTLACWGRRQARLSARSAYHGKQQLRQALRITHSTEGAGGGGLAFLPAFSDLQSSQKCLDDRFASGCDFAQAQHQRLRCPFKFSPLLAAFNLLVHGDQQVVT